MTLRIDTIERPKRIRGRKKTIGRGNSSGHGTYSCRGLKGQKARSGVSRLALKKIGMKHGRSALRDVPKLRGFKSANAKNQVVNTEVINTKFKSGETVSPETLYARGLIAKINKPVKILGKEEIKPKDLKFERVAFSKTLAEKLSK